MMGYAHPEMLVYTGWVEHQREPRVRIAEVDVNTAAYEEGHVPGAIGWNWTTQLCDTVRRDIISKNAFEQLMAGAGIANDYDGRALRHNNNWFAAWALWQMKLYGHKDVRLMNGGRKKWLEESREGIASGLELRHDHGSQFVADDFQAELAFLGIAPSPAFVRGPEGNGCIERFIWTLKENLLWLRRFATIEELRQALHAFKDTSNRTWIIERHGYRTPAQVRADQLGGLAAAA
jgi:hypothetical protein